MLEQESSSPVASALTIEELKLPELSIWVAGESCRSLSLNTSTESELEAVPRLRSSIVEEKEKKCNRREEKQEERVLLFVVLSC